MTHKELVMIGFKWMLANCSVGVAFREFRAVANGEYTDVIGFGSGGHSVIIEVKVSRADFIADKKKRFRLSPEHGMGKQRFYLCPAGLIQKEELPAGWGLVYVTPDGKARKVHTPYKGNIGERHEGFNHNIKAEHGLMYSALRRLHLTGHIELVYLDEKERKLK